MGYEYVLRLFVCKQWIMGNDCWSLCSVCKGNTSKILLTTSGKIISKFHATRMRMFDKPSRMNNLILSVMLVARKLIGIICTQDVVISVVSSFWSYSCTVLIYYNNNWTSQSSTSHFRSPEFKYRPKTQASGLPGQDIVVGQVVADLSKGLGAFTVRNQKAE